MVQACFIYWRKHNWWRKKQTSKNEELFQPNLQLFQRRMHTQNWTCNRQTNRKRKLIYSDLIFKCLLYFPDSTTIWCLHSESLWLMRGTLFWIFHNWLSQVNTSPSSAPRPGSGSFPTSTAALKWDFSLATSGFSSFKLLNCSTRWVSWSPRCIMV